MCRQTTLNWRSWKFAEILVARLFYLHSCFNRVWLWFLGYWKMRHFTCAVGELALMLQAVASAFPSLLFHVGTINLPPAAAFIHVSDCFFFFLFYFFLFFFFLFFFLASYLQCKVLCTLTSSHPEISIPSHLGIKRDKIFNFDKSPNFQGPNLPIPHICHGLTDGVRGEKSVTWRNFKFLYMTYVEKSKIHPHVEKFQISSYDRCGKIWNLLQYVYNLWYFVAF